MAACKAINDALGLLMGRNRQIALVAVGVASRKACANHPRFQGCIRESGPQVLVVEDAERGGGSWVCLRAIRASTLSPAGSSNQ